ncbi:hypothetical protein [Ornithinimicrobium flavum]|uniref:hypothetical protein n=1 Tax=Ornithinimicrobium flavum TaxID=1288636 RepID=UPI00107056FE|nr:hypothetical protein [Ornithinimicrobium flavum]
MVGIAPDALEMPEWVSVGSAPDPGPPTPRPPGGRRTQEVALRQRVTDAARGELTKHYGRGGATPYGLWYGKDWERAYFCAAGWSWCWYQALGEDEARRVIGHQTHGGTAPHRRGFIWTVAILEQHRSRGVPLQELRPGDALLFRYDSGDPRQTNEVNHVDLVEGNDPRARHVDVIGFNVPQPGAPAGSDPGRGGGVWRRRIRYDDRWIVTGLQMPVSQPEPQVQEEWSAVQDHLTTLGLARLRGTGQVGPATRAGITAYARAYGYPGSHDDRHALLNHLEATMSSIHEELAALRREVRDLSHALEQQTRTLGTVQESVSRASLARAVWQYHHEGHGPFNAWWFLRRGLVLNPDHPQYPADPDSPADVERQTAEAVLGREIRPCTGERRDGGPGED